MPIELAALAVAVSVGMAGAISVTVRHYRRRARPGRRSMMNHLPDDRGPC